VTGLQTEQQRHWASILNSSNRFFSFPEYPLCPFAQLCTSTGTRNSFLGVKLPKQEANHSPTAVLKLRRGEQYLHFPICLYHTHENNFTFTKTEVYDGLIYPKI